MKANELTAKDLMEGDWVYGIFSGCPQERITIKYSICSNSYEWKYMPIPLTPEILEKIGFVKESRENHGNNLQYCILTDGLWIDISGENFFEGKLEYVHQLQHALRLCGIEKEIVL